MVTNEFGPRYVKEYFTFDYVVSPRALKCPPCVTVARPITIRVDGLPGKGWVAWLALRYGSDVDNAEHRWLNFLDDLRPGSCALDGLDLIDLLEFLEFFDNRSCNQWHKLDFFDLYTSDCSRCPRNSGQADGLV